jgi:hypothetical protein
MPLNEILRPACMLSLHALVIAVRTSTTRVHGVGMAPSLQIRALVVAVRCRGEYWTWHVFAVHRGRGEKGSATLRAFALCRWYVFS